MFLTALLTAGLLGIAYAVTPSPQLLTEAATQTPQYRQCVAEERMLLYGTALPRFDPHHLQAFSSPEGSGTYDAATSEAHFADMLDDLNRRCNAEVSYTAWAARANGWQRWVVRTRLGL